MNKKTLAATTVLAAALPLTACGSDIDGTYRGDIVGTETVITIEGDTCDVKLKLGQETRDYECSIDTDKKTITFLDGESNYELKGDKLILTEDDENVEELVFTKD